MISVSRNRFHFSFFLVLMLAIGGPLAPRGVVAVEEKAAKTPDAIAGSTRVDAEALIALLDELNDELLLIDARIATDRRQGFIEGSISLPDTETHCQSLAGNIASTASPVLFYCNGVKCGRSVKSVRKALACGYQNVYWFRGGFEEWTTKGYPVIKP